MTTIDDLDPNEDWTFHSVEEFREMISTRDWAYAALTVPGADGEPVETDFRLLICPYCLATVPEKWEKAKAGHIEYHCYALQQVIIASAGIGVGLALTKEQAAKDAEVGGLADVMGRFFDGTPRPADG